MSLKSFRKSIGQARHSIDAFVMVGGTLLRGCSDILAETDAKAIRKRILFPLLNSPWLVAYLEELNVPITEYEDRILIYSGEAKQLGFDVRYHGHPITAWYVVIDNKEVFQKQIGVLTATNPEAVQLLEASRQFSLLFETVWKSAHTEARLPKGDSGEKGPAQFYSCFISYSSKDHHFAERLHADLQSNGVRVWFAPHDLPIGARIRHAIDESIHLHDKLLLVLSENSVSSQWVEQEVETALRKERQAGGTLLFPVRLDDSVFQIGEGWPAMVKDTRNVGDFTNWKDHDSYQKAFDRLLRDLKADA